MVTHNIGKFCFFHISGNIGQMIKSLSALCMLRCLVLRDFGLYLTGNGCCIDHNVFCFSRMYVHSMDHKFSTCRVEIFISYFALISAIYRICKICFEIIQIKQFRPTSDFFIRRKSYPDISVRDSFFLDFLYCLHNRCYSCLVIRTQQRCSIGCDQCSSF